MHVYAASGTQPAPGMGAQPPNELAGPNTPYSVIVLLEWTEEPTDHRLSLVATVARWHLDVFVLWQQLRQTRFLQQP